ncbi:MAG: 16S rRNA (cytidine(1402)-2'-O)-methyltransferase [Burkholderiales bacterium]
MSGNNNATWGSAGVDAGAGAGRGRAAGSPAATGAVTARGSVATSWLLELGKVVQALYSTATRAMIKAENRCMNARAGKSGTLYVVATPIGNLRDITLRALDTLTAADLIAAEDTRVSRRLLEHFSISKRLVALHAHNEHRVAAQLVENLKSGQSVALISDAGTPGINDPGTFVVSRARAEGLKIVPLPGPNAALCAMSVAGFPTSQFLYYGFLPQKSAARRRELEMLKDLPYTLVFYEAPHRVVESARDLAAVLGAQREMVIARELTKLYETLHGCCLGESVAWLESNPERRKGEFVLLVGAAPRCEKSIDSDAERVLSVLLEELPLTTAVKVATRITGFKRGALYQCALRIRDAIPRTRLAPDAAAK